jgi:hypothetical protein
MGSAAGFAVGFVLMLALLWMFQRAKDELHE